MTDAFISRPSVSQQDEWADCASGLGVSCETSRSSARSIFLSHESPSRNGAFRPITPKRAVDEITAQIRERISSGEFRPGNRLPSQRDLAEQFQVSRNTVREAIASLEDIGLVTVTRGATGGAFVSLGTSSGIVTSLSDLFSIGVITPQNLREARAIVGKAAAELAAERATDLDIALLQDIVDRASAYAAKGDIAQRSEANFRFHIELARISGNPILEYLTDAVIHINRKIAARYEAPPNDIVIPFRRRLMTLIKQKRSAEAGMEMVNFLDSLANYYQTAPLLADAARETHNSYREADKEET